MREGGREGGGRSAIYVCYSIREWEGGKGRKGRVRGKGSTVCATKAYRHGGQWKVALKGWRGRSVFHLWV